MEDTNVTFKGTVNGLTIIMKEEETFEDIIDQIESKVLSAGRFFKGSALNVKYKGRKLSSNEETIILDLLKEKSGAEINGIEEDLEEPSSNISISNNLADKMKMKTIFFKGIEEGETKFYRGTVRSGRQLKFSGNIVIIGDVNPGAEIIATGNIVVMGTLRGIVHAGADGNKEAVIVALNLMPTQLRIADVITRPPDDEGNKSQYIPEIALIRDDMVYIERYLPQR